MAMETKKREFGKVGQKQIVHRKSIDTFGQRTSQYRGVTSSIGTDGQVHMKHIYGIIAAKKKGKQGKEGKLENYKDELEEMNNMTRQEYVAHLRSIFRLWILFGCSSCEKPVFRLIV